MTSNSEETEKQSFKSKSAMNLVEGLLKNENSLNYSTIMKMANNLLKDKTLMELVGEMGKSIDEENEEKNSQIQEGDHLSILQRQVEDMEKELAKTKQELASLKKQDTSIIGLGMKVIHAANQDLKKGVSILTGVKNLLK
ncbi:hypothetical protein ACFYKT_06240 [Cytobacillus sp. FJAT-53684]|uniref:DUF1641 domain-containing protein n=1 Tax=Cytobacillus mangrovibacter TaxID=3299024 RepID=A0ABW6JVQ1_9BACI